MPSVNTGIYFNIGQSVIASSSNYYKIVEYKGCGGNAIVFKVQSTSGENRGMIFALKVQYNLSTEKRKERFFIETEFLKECTHPAIIRHIDDGIYELRDGRSYPFVITNFLPTTLEAIIGNQEVTFIRKIEITCQLLSALQYLQSRMLLHRDIKPSNIFISNSDSYLGDFGLLKSVYQSTAEEIDDDVALLNHEIDTDISDLVGYVAMPKRYRTPELVKYANHEGELRLESDVFQLGLVLAELFTGENPLQAAQNITDPINLNAIGRIEGTEDGGLVFLQLSNMLNQDYTRRSSVYSLLASFTGLYEQIMLRGLH